MKEVLWHIVQRNDVRHWYERGTAILHEFVYEITYDSHKILLTVKFDRYQVILQLKKNYAYKSESQLSHDLFNLQARNFYMVLLLGNAFPSLSY